MTNDRYPTRNIDWLAKMGLTHYSNDRHCWCKPVAIRIQMDLHHAPLLMLLHNFDGNGPAEQEIHDTFLYSMLADFLDDYTD